MVEHPLLKTLWMAGIRMGLWRMNSFLQAIGSPHLAAPVLHIAGTNGKGSVCRMLGAVLGASGRRVGVHTSPHLQHLNERFRINEDCISDDDLDRLVTTLQALQEAWASQALPPEEAWPLTYFEFTTALAFQFFAEQRVDAMVMEVGMGGRLDATNVVQPQACAIVTIGLDHMAELGPDHAAIAAEKAGIIKPGVPVVVGPVPPDALRVIRAVAFDKGAPVSVWGEDFDAFGTPDGFTFRSGALEIEGLQSGLSGDHQVINAGVALQVLQVSGWLDGLSERAVRHGLLSAQNPGRLEWLAPDLLVDGAHNPEGAQALVRHLATLPRKRRRTLILGGGVDKDLRLVGFTLAPAVDRILTTACDHPKARAPADVAAQLEGLAVPVIPAGPLEVALPLARQGGDLVIVAGSLYLVGAVRALLGLPIV